MLKLKYTVPFLVLYWQQCAARTITVTNNCEYTVWPAIFTDPNANSAPLDHATGWEAASGTSESFTVPDGWTSARLWGRSGCTFEDADDGAASCSTGGCNGGLECDLRSGTGVPPATLAEFTLNGNGDANLDNYDVSLVDGFNLPMSITNNVGCDEASCPVDLNVDCPQELKVGDDACNSACGAVPLDQRENSPACCTGSFGTPDTCVSSSVPFYDFYKSRCRNSYIYAYDEPSGTALFTCSGSSNADYTITFCP